MSVRAILMAALLLSGGIVWSQRDDNEAIRRIGETEEVRVDLVLIDVVVRDRKDRPVRGLVQDDFELWVDGKPTEPGSIVSFEEVCAPPESTPVAAGASPATQLPAASASEPPQPLPPRHIVIWLDFDNMTWSGRRLSLKSAAEFVATNIAPNDRIMILAHERSLRLVQDFTSSGSLLATRFQELLEQTGQMVNDVLEEPNNMNQVAGTQGDAGGGAIASGMQGRRAAAYVYAVQEEQRARRSIKAMNHVMPALEGLKGRKAMVVFSDALREQPGIEYTTLAATTPDAEGINIRTDLLRMTREANSAGVSLYTVHASGLDDSILEGFRNQRTETRSISVSSGSVTMGSSSGGIGETYAAARAGLDSALGMQTTLATETGGRALQRTSDVGAIIGTAQQDLSCYYLLGYQYDGRGDDSRHMLLLKLLDNNSDRPRGIQMRYRPYYTDHASTSRRDRLLRSALDVPHLYSTVPIVTEAFALAPEPAGRRVLLKTTVATKHLSLLPDGASWLNGSLIAHGEVSREGETACRFEHDLDVRVRRSETAPETLVHETGCVLQPGVYDLTIVLLDRTTRDVGALRSPLVVPDTGSSTSTFISEVHLWTRDPHSILITAGTESIGLKSTTSTGGLIPMAERRMKQGQDGILSFLLCPPDGAQVSSARPIRINRALRGAGDEVVADFRPLLIGKPPDRDTGCYQIVNSIPAQTLGQGLYTFNLELRGTPLNGTVSRDVALAVN